MFRLPTKPSFLKILGAKESIVRGRFMVRIDFWEGGPRVNRLQFVSCTGLHAACTACVTHAADACDGACACYQPRIGVP